MPHRLFHALEHPLMWFVGFLTSTIWGKSLLDVINVSKSDTAIELPDIINPMGSIVQLDLMPDWALQVMVVIGFCLWAVMTTGIAYRVWASGYKMRCEGDATMRTICKFPGDCPYERYRREEYEC